MRNLASSLFLTERDAELDDNAPKVRGRVITTLHKAKEVRPLVEKCVTLARHSLPHEEEARQYAVDAERGSDEWKSWRRSNQWQQWNAAMAPAVAARRRALQLLGDKQAVRVLFDEVAPRFAERPGGYTRILRLARPRLGDAGVQAILEFVGVHDRVVQKSEKPAFDDGDAAPEDQAESDDEQAAAADDDSGDSEEPAAASDSSSEEKPDEK